MNLLYIQNRYQLQITTSCFICIKKINIPPSQCRQKLSVGLSGF